MHPAPRLTCKAYLELLRRDAWAFEEIARRQAVQFIWQEDKLVVDYHGDSLSPAVQQWGNGAGSWILEKMNFKTEMVELWLAAQLVATGPKIFRPSPEQCLALEQVAPRIPLAAYLQPYSVMLVELPEAYCQSRRCPLPGGFLGQTHSPQGVLIGFHPPPVGAVWLTVVFDSGTRGRLMFLPMDLTLEDGIVREFGEGSYANPAMATREERVILAGVTRVAANAMLLLSLFGCKSLGPAQEAHYHRLEHHLQAARKRGRGTAEAERELRLAPRLYGFAQDITLHDDEHTGTGEAGSGEPGDGQTRRPHWRRGHVKTHAYGPGRSLRKLIFIKPVFVNRHLLAWGESSAQNTYQWR